ncbi:MAG: hypothetical protein LBC89_05315 [Bacteroidales bacterium]|jgi:hypothetical protein|nr:hypothetical protein [Bacteroidales bacterium]
MEKNIKPIICLTKLVGFLWIALVGILWLAFTAISLVICVKCHLLYLTHIVLFTIFVTGIVLFLRQSKFENGEVKLNNELERKKQWEESQYDLHKGERLEKQQYERSVSLEKQQYEIVKSLLEKLDSKEVKEDNPLKTEIENLRKEFNEWKAEKDKQVLIDVSKLIKSSKTKK